jgi:hypothetical protein
MIDLFLSARFSLAGYTVSRPTVTEIDTGSNEWFTSHYDTPPRPLTARFKNRDIIGSKVRKATRRFSRRYNTQSSSQTLTGASV